MQPICNIAILAHVDAGKTTLSERILFNAGEVRRPGNVEDGLATMDYLPEERERGITIESGVAHFEWRGIWFNFIDTPGHVDFGAEVDMALSAVDGAILVVSAADGIETQTLSAWRKLCEKGIRTLIFINKLDNPDFSLDNVLIDVEEHLGARPVLLSIPEYAPGKTVCSELDVVSGVRLCHEDGKEEPRKLSAGDGARMILEGAYAEAVEAASEFDDEILSLAMDGNPVSPKLLIRGLSLLAASGKYVLCYAGSAKENFGVRSLMTGLSFFLPTAKPASGNFLGKVLRLRHFPHSGEMAIFLSAANLSATEIPGGLKFFRMKASSLVPVESICAGDIYAVRSERELSLGECVAFDGSTFEGSRFDGKLYDPLLQTHVECVRAEDYPVVEKCLRLLARMDPSVKVSPKPEAGAWILHTVGEVQLEVVLERLHREFGLELRAGNPDVEWRERLSKSLSPVGNSFQAGPFRVALTLSAKPLPVEDRRVVLRGRSLDLFPGEILEGIRSALSEWAQVGVLGKGELVGVEFDVESFDFAEGTPVPMIKKACSDAAKKLILPSDVVLFEPYVEIFLECPAEYAGLLTGDILSRGGKITEVGGNGSEHSFRAELPFRKLFGYATAVRSGCKGRAQYSMKIIGYREFEGL